MFTTKKKKKKKIDPRAHPVNFATVITSYTYLFVNVIKKWLKHLLITALRLLRYVSIKKKKKKFHTKHTYVSSKVWCNKRTYLFRNVMFSKYPLLNSQTPTFPYIIEPSPQNPGPWSMIRAPFPLPQSTHILPA
jgi:hypothetical protein